MIGIHMMCLGPLKEGRGTPKQGRDPHYMIGTPEGEQGDPTVAGGPQSRGVGTPKQGRDPHNGIGTPEGGQGDPKAGQGPPQWDWDP